MPELNANDLDFLNDAISKNETVHKTFDDLSKFAKNFQIPKDKLKYLKYGKFTDEDVEIMRLQSEIQEKNNQLSSDMEYYGKYLLPLELGVEDSTSKLAKFPKELKAKLEAMNDYMRGELDETLKSIRTDDALEIALSVMVEEFTAALKPFEQVPNMPNIPLIGDLGEFIHTLGEMGKVERMIQKNLTADQKREWKEKMEAQKYNADGTEKSFMQRMRESSVGQILKEIKDVIMEIVHMLPMLINFYWMALLNELIKALKPVFDAFGIVAGTFMNLMESVPEFLTSSWKLAQTLGYKLLKIAYDKLENIFGIFFLIGDVQGSVEDQVLIVQRDILSCQYDIEDKGLQIQTLSGKKTAVMSEREIQRLEKKIPKAKNEADKEILESAKESMEEINLKAKESILNAKIALAEFRAGGIEAFAESKNKAYLLVPDDAKNVELTS